ncbi:MAG: hydrogenase maturation protease, partial [Desulfobacterota bacterium]|nr:hydrogenase maturation protease [Thermodesulfobacteriota bacterium]
SAGEFLEDWLIRILDFRPEFILLVDAVNIQAEPGSIAILDADDLPESSCLSTHRLPLRTIAKFWEEKGSKTLLLAIQPERFNFGEEVSSRVESSINKLIELIPPLHNLNSVFLDTKSGLIAEVEKEFPDRLTP